MRAMREAERTVLAIARRQHGVVGLRQARQAGVSASAWKRLVASGRLVLVHRGVARVAASPASFPGRALAGVLAVGPTARTSHGTAATLWGADLPCPVIDVTTTERSRGARPAGIRLHRPRDLDDLAPVRRLAVPTTNPLRTILDLGATCPAATVEATLECFVVARLVSPLAVKSALGRHARPGRGGLGALRSVLARWELAATTPDSRLEICFARFLATHGLPPAVHHHRVGRYELDFAWPGPRVALEVDSWAFHGSRTAFEHDRRRDLEFAALGWHVLRATKAALLAGPPRLAASLSAALARRVA